MAELREDLRFAVRVLRKDRGFTTVAVLTLALAIGANTAIFSVVNGALLKPLPFAQPEQLFHVVRHDQDRDNAPVSMPQYAFVARQPWPFSRLMAHPSRNSGFNLSGEGAPEWVPGTSVTQGFFEVLGVRPLLGRDFLPEEEQVGGPRVVVLGHELWQGRFGGRADILGQTLMLNAEPYTVIGVAPPGFSYPEQVQLWTPLQISPETQEMTHYLTVVGRLRPDADPQQVRAGVEAQGEQLRRLHPERLLWDNKLSALGLQVLATRSVRSALLVLMAAVGLVLLIACVNLASLQLARASARERELAIRAALGASSGRLARQLLTESLLLSGAGSVLGVLLATVCLPALLALAPAGALPPGGIRIDGAVLVFTFGAALVASLLFGVLPAWQAARVEPRGLLQAGALQATSGAQGMLMRKLLVVSAVALSVILLVGAALLARSFTLLRRVRSGVDSQGVLTMRLTLSESRYGHPEQLEAFTLRVVERVRALPGVEAVGFALSLPFEIGVRLDLSHPDSTPGVAGPELVALVHYRPVTGGYFDALKVRLVSGRLLDELDQHGGAPVVVINETAARLQWPGSDPLGQRILLGRAIPFLAENAPREVVGVVRDVHELGLRTAPPPIAYVPLGQISPKLHARYLRLTPQRLLVRARGDAATLFEDIQREVLAVDPLQPVVLSEPMEELVSRQVSPERFNTLLMGLLASLALGLAAIGVYGVLSYTVSQRARELGVRMALGATRAQVVWLVMRQGMGLVGMGMALGVVGALALSRLLTRLLYEVSPLDAPAFSTALGVLLGVALAATLLPALRASRVDPMVALRAE